MADIEEKLRECRRIATETAERLAARVAAAAKCPTTDNAEVQRQLPVHANGATVTHKAGGGFSQPPPQHTHWQPPPPPPPLAIQPAAKRSKTVADEEVFGGSGSIADGARFATERSESNLRLTGPQDPDLEGMQYTVVRVPEECIGLLIGKGGYHVNQIEAEAGVSIKVGKLNIEGERSVCIIGEPQNQERARVLINNTVEMVMGKPGTKGHRVSESFDVPERLMGTVMGRNGSVIRQLRELFGVKMVFSDDRFSPSRRMTISGSAENVGKARERFEIVLLDAYRRKGIFNTDLEAKLASRAALAVNGGANGDLGLLALNSAPSGATSELAVAVAAGNMDEEIMLHPEEVQWQRHQHQLDQQHQQQQKQTQQQQQQQHFQPQQQSQERQQQQQQQQQQEQQQQQQPQQDQQLMQRLRQIHQKRQLIAMQERRGGYTGDNAANAAPGSFSPSCPNALASQEAIDAEKAAFQAYAAHFARDKLCIAYYRTLKSCVYFQE
eukprot:TRINITY_DN38122_c1_g1_i1.p1 TRINITY_DN38122_c1_g1~~TRINITY_DN38122_c1_g1_i1.p1  ORF type:complete len:517 (-),score=135.90 TRINITY_DN38122_c1_g1_i1:121-1611(-)